MGGGAGREKKEKRSGRRGVFLLFFFVALEVLRSAKARHLRPDRREEVLAPPPPPSAPALAPRPRPLCGLGPAQSVGAALNLASCT